MTGNVTYKFSDIRSLTVPAGTYNVFRMDVSGSNLTASSSTAGVLLSTNMSLNCQEYFEYGTCWPIDINIQENASYQSVGQNSEMASYTMTYYFHMVLVQDIKH